VACGRPSNGLCPGPCGVPRILVIVAREVVMRSLVVALAVVLSVAVLVASYGLLLRTAVRALAWWVRRRPGNWVQPGSAVLLGLTVVVLLGEPLLACVSLVGGKNDTPPLGWAVLCLIFATVHGLCWFDLSSEYEVPTAELGYLRALRRVEELMIEHGGQVLPISLRNAADARLQARLSWLSGTGRADLEAALAELERIERAFIALRNYRANH
jgi:hypothetical protein